MTTLPTAHREGNARMTRALSGSTALYFRVAGHAGVWELDGHALVLTDDDQFEHPTQLVVHQVADPDHYAVVEAADLTPFTPTAVTGECIAV